MRKRVKQFDPRASLAGFIAEMERATGHRAEPEPGEEVRALTERAQGAFGDFVRGIAELHRAEGLSAGVSILIDDFERVARRAVRLAAEHGEALAHGTECAPQTVDKAPKPSAGAGESLIEGQGDGAAP